MAPENRRTHVGCPPEISTLIATAPGDRVTPRGIRAVRGRLVAAVAWATARHAMCGAGGTDGSSDCRRLARGSRCCGYVAVCVVRFAGRSPTAGGWSRDVVLWSEFPAVCLGGSWRSLLVMCARATDDRAHRRRTRRVRRSTASALRRENRPLPLHPETPTEIRNEDDRWPTSSSSRRCCSFGRSG